MCSTGLFRYLYPTDLELKQLANIPNKPKARKAADNGRVKMETFHFPRNLDIRLETAKVSPYDVIHLRFYAEYQWLTDFAMYTFGVYAITELYQVYFSIKDEINLSMLWCGLVLLFSM